ncbi:hypothetical protein GH733_019040 [Mirounga leonina]|nr:hypothetical protein GH733_019040 [Mirounga leonina]
MQWAQHYAGMDWHYLHQYIKDMIYKANASTYRDISNNKHVSCWPMINTTWNSPDHKRAFSYPQTIKIMTEYANSKIKDKKTSIQLVCYQLDEMTRHQMASTQWNSMATWYIFVAMANPWMDRALYPRLSLDAREME